MIGLKKAARIRAIHAACRANGIDADARHDLQLALTGKASLSEMDFIEVTRVLDHLNRRGNAGNEWRFVFALPEERKRLAQKLYRQAERVGAMQNPPVKIMSPQYMAGIARRMLGYDKPGFENVVVRLEMATAETLHKMVQAMEKHMKRHGA